MQDYEQSVVHIDCNLTLWTVLVLFVHGTSVGASSDSIYLRMIVDTGCRHGTPPQPPNWRNYCQSDPWWWPLPCHCPLLPFSSPSPTDFFSAQWGSCIACFGTKCGWFFQEPKWTQDIDGNIIFLTDKDIYMLQMLIALVNRLLFWPA